MQTIQKTISYYAPVTRDGACALQPEKRVPSACQRDPSYWYGVEIHPESDIALLRYDVPVDDLGKVKSGLGDGPYSDHDLLLEHAVNTTIIAGGE